MIQFLLLSLLSIITGAVLCLAAVTDPNAAPSQRRQDLFPIGLCLILIPIGTLGGASAASLLNSSSAFIGTIIGLIAVGVGGAGGLAAGLWLGRMRNRRFWALQRRHRGLTSGG